MVTRDTSVSASAKLTCIGGLVFVVGGSQHPAGGVVDVGHRVAADQADLSQNSLPRGSCHVSSAMSPAGGRLLVGASVGPLADRQPVDRACLLDDLPVSIRSHLVTSMAQPVAALQNIPRLTWDNVSDDESLLVIEFE
jgi:hypothetical protein